MTAKIVKNGKKRTEKRTQFAFPAILISVKPLILMVPGGTAELLFFGVRNCLVSRYNR